MNSDQLKKFLTITNSKSLSEAADKLYITQSALSHSIADLEDELGCKLFTREKKNLVLTSSGNELLRYARAITSLMAQAKDTLTANETLRIAAINVCAAYMLQNYPEKLLPFVNLVQLNEDEMPVALRRELIDIAACDDFYIKHDKMVTLRKFLLCRERLILLVPQGHRFYDMKTISYEELEGEPLSMRTDFLSLKTWIDNIIKTTGTRFNIAFSMDRYTYEFLGRKLPYPEIREISSIYDKSRSEIEKDGYHIVGIEGEYSSRYIYLWYLEGNYKKVEPIIESVKKLYGGEK